VITSIEISGLRGIRNGTLEDFAPLTVLMGPNGCGKSTVLEALLLGAASDLGAAVELCVRRRLEIVGGARFLCSDTAIAGESTARLAVRRLDRPGAQDKVRLSWKLGPSGLDVNWQEWSTIRSVRESSSKAWTWVTGCGIDNVLASRYQNPNAPRPDPGVVRLLDQRFGSPRDPLTKIYTETRKRGAAAIARDLIRELAPDLEVIEILTPDNEPMLHLSFPDRSVPVALSGDGMELAVRLALELSGRDGGLFLIEEPEAHQHIAAMQRSAKVIAAAVRSGARVVLTTHSLEFLDLLLDATGEQRLKDMALFQLRLKGGQLDSRRLSGEEIRRARSVIEQDLR